MSRSRLLVAVSSPWASDKLTAPIADLARRLDAQAVVVHVAQHHEDDDDESQAAQRGEQTLKTLTEALKAQGIDAEGLMLFSDDTTKAILNTARARQCTLIVLGVTGRGMFKRLIWGDVPGSLMRQAEVPVLLWPANWGGTV